MLYEVWAKQKIGYSPLILLYIIPKIDHLTFEVDIYPMLKVGLWLFMGGLYLRNLWDSRCEKKCWGI